MSMWNTSMRTKCLLTMEESGRVDDVVVEASQIDNVEMLEDDVDVEVVVIKDVQVNKLSLMKDR